MSFTFYRTPGLRHAAALALGLGVAVPTLAQSVPTGTLPATTVGMPQPKLDGDRWWREGDRLFVGYSLYTWHRTNNPEHVSRNHLVTLEIHSDFDRVWGADKTLFGVSTFRNSFGQQSAYIYWGQRWELNDWFYAKVTAGPLWGYRGKYRDKIPFNKFGVAPAIIPSVGIKLGREASAEAILLGFNAIMFAVGYRF